MVNIQIHYNVRFDVATSNFVAHIVPTASSNSGVRRLLGTPQLFQLAVKVPLSQSRCGITAKGVCDGVER